LGDWHKDAPSVRRLITLMDLPPAMPDQTVHVRVIFKDGKPTGEYEDFITGFVLSDKEVWGRPVGVAVGKDGSMYFSEDGNGTIWRVAYRR